MGISELNQCVDCVTYQDAITIVDFLILFLISTIILVNIKHLVRFFKGLL